MGSPTTTLDTRFSDPGAVPTAWEETVSALERAELFWITTVRADGRPHTSPLVAVWLDGALHFSTGADEQKAVNLRTNAHVILTTGCNQWDRGLDVVVEGDADQVDDDSTLRRLADGVENEMGRPLAVPGPRWGVPPRRRHGARVRRRATQGPRLRQGHLQPHPTRVLSRLIPPA